jgi:hypothetical protein
VSRLRTAACLFAIALTAASARAEPQPTLATVLDRAATYVEGFERQLSGIVAEEHYVQEVLTFAKKRQDPIRIELRSDLGLVRPAGAATWAEFRDVFESNGTPVRDRTERLTRLFLVGAADSRAQIGRILSESARFNIGDISRNVNTPLFPLQFLERRNQPRFAFKRGGKHQPATFSSSEAPTAAFRVAVDVWIVEYEEKQEGTIIRTQGLRDLPSRGRFWIEPDTGRVLMSELVARNRDLHATIDVSYQSEPLLGCLVPIEMREDYQNRQGSHISGAASYGRFRQFQVDVDEKFLPVIKR